MTSRRKWFCNHSLISYFIILTYLVRAGQVKEITISDVASKDYDYLHPPRNTSEPLTVNISISKLTIRSVDESDMSLTLTLEMQQSWFDHRLNVPEWATKRFTVLDSSWIDKIWNPKLYFRNSVDGKLDNIITPSSFFWLGKDLRVLYTCRVILKLICEMDLKYFPHDVQECGIQMSSSIYSAEEILLEWRERRRKTELFSLQQFEISELKYNNYTEIVGLSRGISCLELAFVMHRRIGFYFINVYIPTVLIVIMSMLTFWIPPDAVPARITLGVTSLLTIITKQYQASLPNVSYIVALNIWLSCCIGFVFFSLLEFATVIALNGHIKNQRSIQKKDFIFPLVMLKSNGTWCTQNNWSSKMKKENNCKTFEAVKLDYFSRVFFPLSFVIFIIVYWKIYK